MGVPSPLLSPTLHKCTHRHAHIHTYLILRWPRNSNKAISLTWNHGSFDVRDMP